MIVKLADGQYGFDSPGVEPTMLDHKSLLLMANFLDKVRNDMIFGTNANDLNPRAVTQYMLARSALETAEHFLRMAAHEQFT